ncbi:zinc-binding dehydrogenase [Oceanimonas sp. MB9]|uniref:alcohol dehydrogenase catalytic domain-containing protein n=1 Tax=Oceanimonas sp. MB9 TaxID=2588453 RepID=UPI0013F63344|nr:zinc-binding dehydrogenase [Oceanimonas sp. MB9]NHI00226.1 Zinc-type alcohol dehydrogenase-like protein [Oceanimonas sp. MB9]
MKAITYQKQQDQFRLDELAVPRLQTDYDVLIKVYAVGLNPVDAKVNLWHAMVEQMDDQFVGGLDVSGEICAVGSKVTGWKVGDRVLYHGNMRRHHGGFAEYALQDARTLVTHPAVDPVQAAATPCAGWTAYRALVDKLNIAERKNLFVAGGAGGVGGFAIQLARYFGIDTIVATASAANHDYLRSLGATHPLDYRQSNLLERVLQVAGPEGMEASLDAVGGANAALAADVLGYEGHMVELVDTINGQAFSDAFGKGLSFHQLSLGSGHVNGEHGRNTIVQAGKAFSSLLEAGQIICPRLQVIELSDIGDALMEMRQQRTVGKVVATISG